MFPHTRMRRLRRTAKLRSLLRETELTPRSLVYPIFVREGLEKPEAIPSLPGQFRLPPWQAAEKAREARELGVPAVMLFGIPAKKDEMASSAWGEDGVVQRAISEIRRRLGDELVVATDVCLCQYTPHGHCGVVKGGEVDNDSTLEVLGKIAVSHAAAGADMVAPSAMMDGQVRAIRQALDDRGYKNTAIMAYSAKHASGFYGPFREAAHSAPSFGDRRSYQMDFGNPREAIREVRLDVEEGADIVMVKPALAYLDVIYRIRRRFELPLAAYNVSGEFSALKAAAERGWLDERLAVLEVLTAIRRAGADLIITYHALEASQWLAKTT